MGYCHGTAPEVTCPLPAKALRSIVGLTSVLDRISSVMQMRRLHRRRLEYRNQGHRCRQLANRLQTAHLALTLPLRLQGRECLPGNPTEDRDPASRGSGRRRRPRRCWSWPTPLGRPWCLLETPLPRLGGQGGAARPHPGSERSARGCSAGSGGLRRRWTWLC
ncbi:hypothetical protein ACTIVE_3380 [Actinomadura verrucosospora]|uniref:Uncharacterized protein n=1 Tax=Actinomadura verrucosospora TaxID=46165 RepID=A0A7D3ZLZ2_ACTVE|nr:hypothetical protein ACTIVE_3380 [Actinomadura verrucosospora]